MPYSKQPCKSCGKLIQMIYNRTEYNHSGLCRECFEKERADNLIAKWKETGYAGCENPTGVSDIIRRYVLKKQDGVCAICGIKQVWNNKPLIFILDHIDGTATNHSENNLRLICPNCDSQLTTYKRRNRKSARIHRYDKKHKSD